MKLLQEGISSGAVTRTAHTRKLTLDGTTQIFPVFRIRLDLLYFNEQNDRIATWVSQYQNTHDGLMPSDEEREVFNQIIEKFIIESNPEAIRKTQTNIELLEQKEPGIVLNDGRIIDGNRRFTCLRALARKSERYNGFEAVILERDIEKSAKQIKMLELEIQHGEEKKVDYSLIDMLVGMHQDIEQTHLLTTAEYARCANISESEVKTRLETAKLMVDFLDYINAPGQYYIARDLSLAYPLEELQKMLKKCSSTDEMEDLKICMFTNLLIRTAGDQTKFIRSIKSIVNSDYRDDYVEEQLSIAEKVADALPPKGQMNYQVIRDIFRGNDEIRQALERSTEKAIDKTRKTETRNFPIHQLERATNFVETIDTNIFLKMNDSEIRRLEHQLQLLEVAIEGVRSSMP